MSEPACFPGLCVRRELQARCDVLRTALKAAEDFIADDTCRHDSEKAPVLALIRAALKQDYLERFTKALAKRSA